MQVIQIITLMFSAVSCIFICYLVGLYDGYVRDLRKTSHYMDELVQQLGERHSSELEMISALKTIIELKERAP